MLLHRFQSRTTQCRTAIAFMTAMVCVVATALALSAQGTPEWSTPQRLNLWDSDNSVDFPDAVADPFGRVHVVTVRNDTVDGSGLFYYSRLDERGWSTPLDILISPNRGTSRGERLVSDQNGMLFLLWSELNNGLFLSESHSLEAASANAWGTSQVAVTGTTGDLVMENDQIDLVYVAGNRDIFFLSSIDRGRSWSNENLAWSPASDNQAVFTIRLAKGVDGILHMAWTETDASLDWNPSAVWYARSLDNGHTWQDYLRIPDMGSYINIGFDRLGNVHLLWNHNVGSADGRYHSISMDNGKTWAEPQWIFPGLSGRTGFPQMLLDSSGTLHQLTSGRGFDLEGGVYHSTWMGNGWSMPVLISSPIPEDNNEGPVGTIIGGNTMHVIWRNNFLAHDIFHAWARIDAQPESLLSLPTALPDRTGTLPGKVIEPPPTLVQDQVQTAPNVVLEVSPSTRRGPLSPILISSLVAILFVTVVVGWQLRRDR